MIFFIISFNLCFLIISFLFLKPHSTIVKKNQEIFTTPVLESAKTPQNSPFKDVLYTAPLSDNLNEELQNRLINHKKKVYNELTESFETPNSSTLSPVNTSIAIPLNDTCEIGEDPLSFTDESSFKLCYEPDHQQETVQNDLDELSNSCDTINADDNETRSYCSNDRESSVEVIKDGPHIDLDSTNLVESNDLSKKINLDTTSINNSFITAFTKLSVSPRCAEDVINVESHVDNQESTFDDDKNLSNKVRRDSGASILVISSSSNELPSEIPQNIISNIDKCEIEDSANSSLVLDPKLMNTHINPTVVSETIVVEINANGCENVVGIALQDDIKLIPNSEDLSLPSVSEENSKVKSIEQEIQVTENTNNISNCIPSQNNETVESIQQTDVQNDKELNEFTDLVKDIEFNDNKNNSEKDIVCETKNLQVVINQNEPTVDSSFCEPMDCDDSYIVKNYSEIIEAINPHSTLLNSVQESVSLNDKNPDLEKSYVFETPIDSTLNKNIPEIIQCPNPNSTELNITREIILEPSINNEEGLGLNTKKEEGLELNINKDISDLSNTLHENISSESTNNDKSQVLNTSDGHELVENAEKETNITSTNHSEESVSKEENLEKENILAVEGSIHIENNQNQYSGDDTLTGNISEKLSKSLSSDSLEAFNLEEKNCEISNISDSSRDNTLTCINDDVEKSNLSESPLKIESIENENTNNEEGKIEKPNITNIDDIPIKCKPINYNEIDFDLENPFSTRAKVRNSVEKENTNNVIIENSKNLKVESQSFEKKTDIVAMDTSYIVEKSNVVNMEKPLTEEKSNTIAVEKPLVKEKFKTINIDNPFATITKVRNSTNKSINLEPDVSDENSNNPVVEIKSQNGNVETKTAKITPNAISKDANENDTALSDLKAGSEKPNIVISKDEAFKSPVALVQNKRVSQISKTAPKGNLSPMSRCGDLMGLSPVTNTNTKNTAECIDASEFANDFLTGKELHPDYDDVMEVDDDDFKMPCEFLFYFLYFILLFDFFFHLVEGT